MQFFHSNVCHRKFELCPLNLIQDQVWCIYR